MQLTSPHFNNGGSIPKRFACDGEGQSPELHIGSVPKSARSLALVVHNPDAPSGEYVHWLVWNIPIETEKLLPDALPDGAAVGLNSKGESAYDPPCPDTGVNRYIFTLYALDTELELDASCAELSHFTEKITGHILSETELVGLYCRDGNQEGTH